MAAFVLEEMKLDERRWEKQTLDEMKIEVIRSNKSAWSRQ